MSAVTTARSPRTPQAYLQSAGRWRTARDRVLARDPAAVRRCSRLSGAGEPDRDHGAVRALARSDPRLCRHRLARPCGVLRHRRLYGAGLHRQIRLGRADHRAAGRAASPPASLGYLDELHHRALPPSRADHDHARPRPAAAEAANSASWLTGGADGLQGIHMWPLLGMFQFDLYGNTAYGYSLVVLFLVVSRWRAG